MASTVEEIRDRVKQFIAHEPEAADFRITIFDAALTSYKRATVCQPFPEEYGRGDNRDYLALERLINRLHSIQEISHTIQTQGKKQMRFLDWLYSRGLQLRKIPVDRFESETQFLKSFSSRQLRRRPDVVLEVSYMPSHPLTSTAFEQLKSEYGSFIGYHGSAMYNWHSILHNGFDVNFCRHDDVIFGSGIYFSTDPAVGMNFVRPSKTWVHSSLGASLGCLVACEIVNHPTVKRSPVDSPAAQSQDSPYELDPKLPKSYVLVTHNAHVRVKYVLLFRSDAPQRSRRGLFIILIYAFILLFVAFLRSRRFWLMQQYLSQQAKLYW